ncbi:hypothetical protein [Paenibacillus aceti]|uniref:Uncharacterized protein n=1 Tax=Paenibacillus aceti TaxID=1820010 RepID=A0ABQ1W565_9BACL|nr:hypothetical protein [Paenibacillus aceti]GGG15612.1 hypothetical protein GCM10010913_41930 [Paenibacillus aceti]
MSLSEWINGLQQHATLSLTAILVLVAFLALYGVTDWRIRAGLRSRLEHLEKSIKLYSAASAPLLSSEADNKPIPELENELIDRLLACRAAPYATADLLGQIGAYIDDRDNARLPLLLRSLERENERFIEERDKLLGWLERPSWGIRFWLRLKPAIPFLFAAALFILVCQLLERWTGINPELQASGTLDTIYFYVRIGSALFSLLLLYPALMGGFRPSEGSILLRLWGFLVAAFYLLHFVSPVLAPYIAAAQILLFLGGFLFTRSTPRKARPFVGHYQISQTNRQSVQPVQAVDKTDAGPTNTENSPQSSPLENTESFLSNKKDR